jgi:L-asparagine transporter-like permease
MNFLEDKFTFALTKYNKTIELILGVSLLVNNFNNNNKEEKFSNVIVKGLLPTRHGGVKSSIFC